jgi:hypothetical protein
MASPTNPNYYWSRAVRYQGQQGQGKHGNQGRQQAPSKQEKRVNDHGGFDSLVLNQRCRIKTGTGEVIEGLITATSKFWYLVNVDGQVVIINKAYVVSVMPVQSPTNNQQKMNNPVGEVSGNDKREASRQK